jgi:hypothetical protein
MQGVRFETLKGYDNISPCACIRSASQFIFETFSLFSYAIKYGYFKEDSLGRGRRTLVSCFSTVEPQFFSHHYLEYLITRFDAHIHSIGEYDCEGAARPRVPPLPRS